MLHRHLVRHSGHKTLRKDLTITHVGVDQQSKAPLNLKADDTHALDDVLWLLGRWLHWRLPPNGRDVARWICRLQYVSGSTDASALQ